MTRLIQSSLALATLVGFLVVVEIAEARNPAQRRLRPGQGFWGSSAQTQPGNYNSYNYGATRSYTPQQQYVAPQQQYVAPRQYVPQQQYAMPRQQYVQPRTYVVQPRTTAPVQVVTPAPKRTEVEVVQSDD